ncbi:aminotransferase class V-fold PLP-dependent enzyme, partial [Staphylococcus haemolyticus]|uniref:aminotransferase class V-fold PLP-dependent enzyme n=1 Tax=Staphylococcus haemolyticus TaxID=1283 RepID=UPI00374FC534
MYAPPKQPPPPLITFNFPHIHPHHVPTPLHTQPLPLTPPHHSPQPLIKSFNLSSTPPPTFYLYNTKQHLHQLLQPFKQTNHFF